jgi:dCTP deaminase
MRDAQVELKPAEDDIDVRGKGCLSDKDILRHRDKGYIHIEPFDRDNLNTSSYDVTLGKYFFRERAPDVGVRIYNIYDEDHVDRVWGKEPEEAIKKQAFIDDPNYLKDYLSELAIDRGFLPKELSIGSIQDELTNIDPDERIIFLFPGETILGHTNEFIGGRKVDTTMMKARSSFGRNFISICKCAGWGDVGYVNRWTMEISNSSHNHHIIPLVVGRRCAQIIFLNTGETIQQDYSDGVDSKYQTSTDVDHLMENWEPRDMLPKMYKDRDI